LARVAMALPMLAGVEGLAFVAQHARACFEEAFGRQDVGSDFREPVP